MNTGWWEIDIRSCYSSMKAAFAPVFACKNNRRIWRHNVSTSRSRDVPDRLWWRHNAKSEKTVLSDNGPMMVRWLFFSGMVCSGHRLGCNKYDNTFVTVNKVFLVTSEVICQRFSRVTNRYSRKRCSHTRNVARTNEYRVWKSSTRPESNVCTRQPSTIVF